jgi:hypothetical protein
MPDMMEALSKYVMVTLTGPTKAGGMPQDSLLISLAKQTGEKAVFHRSWIETLRAEGWEGLEQIPSDQIVDDVAHPTVRGLRVVPVEAAQPPSFGLEHRDAKGVILDEGTPQPNRKKQAHANRSRRAQTDGRRRGKTT